jgi:hypothetical protein
MEINRLTSLAALCCSLAAASIARGESPDLAKRVSLRSEFSWQSLVGEQLWSDVVVYGAWRIQRHELRSRYRLLDPSDVERLVGSEEQCRAELARLKQRGVIPPLDGAAVITLHGFGRSRDHMRSLGTYLADNGKYTWINVNYSSTRGAIDDHAATLAGVIDELDGIDEIHFACHSLGNLVVRRYLHEAATSDSRWQTDPRIRRMVMLGPPNQGAKAAALIADILHESPLARLITGPAAWQLARHWDTVSPQLATPQFEFGILAGGFSDDRGYNPLLAGDDDLVVRVEETRLAGAADFRLVACRHGRMMREPAIQQYVLHFLEHGCFTCPEEKQSIPPAKPAAGP